jgi:hypothetical protein
MVKSNFTGKTYDPKKAVRILNMYQAAAYMNHGVALIDLWSSKDIKTGKPILVFIFDRDESKEAYDLWCNHELG